MEICGGYKFEVTITAILKKSLTFEKADVLC